ncbi:hypothetical protein KIS4809_0451 [Bacillus sp. ZZV12-4809]|nr:hypothetical protein KIS4809_0451 [Bacillus sp. ZZV12-4809]
MQLGESSMLYIKFCLYQFVLFSALLVLNFILDQYISRPFTRVDLIAICISVPVLIIGFIVINKLHRHFEDIRLRNKILIAIPIFILSIFFMEFLVSLL